MTSLVFTRRVNNDRSNPPRGSRTTVMEEQCVEGSLSNLPIVLREVVLGYLAPEELYIVFKNHLQQQCPAIQRYVKEVTPDYALRYAARTGWLDGLKECELKPTSIMDVLAAAAENGQQEDQVAVLEWYSRAVLALVHRLFPPHPFSGMSK